MLELSFPIAFALLLLAVSLLFARKPSERKKDWALLVAFVALALAVSLLIFVSQYSKLMRGASVFSLLGHTYGVIALAASVAVVLIGLIAALWKDFNK